MNPRLLLLLAVPALALSGCGGSDAGAPRPASSLAAAPTVAPSDSSAPAAAFVVRVSEGEAAQSFVVKITDPETIDTARRLVRGPSSSRPVLSGELRAGSGGYNIDPKTGRAWSWHMEPDTVRFVDASIEIYDGRPSDIEGDLGYWLRLGRYAPWGNHFERELKKGQ